jgi:hypothetical protein
MAAVIVPRLSYLTNLKSFVQVYIMKLGISDGRTRLFASLRSFPFVLFLESSRHQCELASMLLMGARVLDTRVWIVRDH